MVDVKGFALWLWGLRPGSRECQRVEKRTRPIERNERLNLGWWDNEY